MKAKVDFLWYAADDEIKEEDSIHVSEWQKQGLIDSSSKKEELIKDELVGDVKGKKKKTKKW